MKTLWGALALGAGLSLTSLAHAQDCTPTPECPCPAAQDRVSGPLADEAPTLPIDDGDDAEEMRQLEEQLNEILLVDETGRITLREEFKSSLPFPAERLEMMLASFTELGDDGRIRLKNPDMIRPYLPMIRGFLSQGGLDKLRALRDLPPEQRREAMRRMMAEQQNQLRERQDEERVEPAPQPDRPARPERTERRERPGRPERAELPDRPRVGPRGDILERLERIERSVERIERTLRGTLERHGEQLRGRADGEGRGRGMLERMFRHRGPERMLERGRTYRDGMRKLMQLMGPEDTKTLRKALEALSGDLKAEDLRDPMALLPKLQESLTPEETVRLMEIFSEFIASPEGRAMAEELDASVERLEELVNSSEGQRLLDAMRRLQERRGGAEDGERLGARLEQLIRPRREREGARAERPRGSAERRHRDRDEPARNPSAKLY